MAHGLTEKQRRFVEAYMGEAAGNGTEAARLAGYKGNSRTLGQVASENLAKPDIAKAIASEVAADPLVLSREDLQRFWSRAVQGQEDVDRLKASELLAKSQAMFVHRIEVKQSQEEWLGKLEEEAD